MLDPMLDVWMVTQFKLLKLEGSQVSYPQLRLLKWAAGEKISDNLNFCDFFNLGVGVYIGYLKMLKIYIQNYSNCHKMYIFF